MRRHLDLMRACTVTALLLAILPQASVAESADDDDAERACIIINDYAVLASRLNRWPPTPRAERRLPSLYDRCSRHEDACLATREELEDRGWDDGQLVCVDE
jgi:hypothetical protein